MFEVRGALLYEYFIEVTSVHHYATLWKPSSSRNSLSGHDKFAYIMCKVTGAVYEVRPELRRKWEAKHWRNILGYIYIFISPSSSKAETIIKQNLTKEYMY